MSFANESWFMKVNRWPVKSSLCFVMLTRASFPHTGVEMTVMARNSRWRMLTINVYLCRFWPILSEILNRYITIVDSCACDIVLPDCCCGGNIGTHSHQVLSQNRRIVQLCRGSTWRQPRHRSVRLRSRQTSSSHSLSGWSASSWRAAGNQSRWKGIHGKWKVHRRKYGLITLRKFQLKLLLKQSDSYSYNCSFCYNYSITTAVKESQLDYNYI